MNVLTQVVSQCLANNVMITRFKVGPYDHAFKGRGEDQLVAPALKVCVTSGLSRKEIEKAGVTIRHAVTKILTKKSSGKST